MASIGRALRRPWIVPFYFLVFGFLAFRLPNYLGFDPSKSTAATRLDLPFYYPLLVAHIVFGSVAFVTASIQVWPWLRNRYPKLHRISGRVYVLGGALPAGLAILTITPFLTHGAGQKAGNALLGLLWLGTTIVGFRRARQGRIVEHREWMLRSFALCFSILASRFWLGPAILWLEPEVFTMGVDGPAAVQDQVSTLTSWIPWVVNLLIAEWFNHRARYKALGRQAAKRAAAKVTAAAPAPAVAVEPVHHAAPEPALAPNTKTPVLERPAPDPVP
ncbi:DUF2306 domain-containing protein [Amycolatopsis sp. FBCC-B4732]|uniref:DUF2306 domain-containing protein n=1 Tax=unclassified Amycolatopsis TaxID=2618356 RepID=UPI001FF6BD3F|nr:DUF2306 domain-containing protein [Amycolatopsis sp. FBCC-B4732]UOX92935.1 DUF2306 domain-containing protein [Amycolatopsis sp. FBCC-B4732]